MKPLHDIAPETLRWMVTLLRLENRELQKFVSGGVDSDTPTGKPSEGARTAIDRVTGKRQDGIGVRRADSSRCNSDPLASSSGSDMAKVGAISIAAETQCSHVLPDSDSGKEQ